MTGRIQLQYELARIDVEKRQLKLEELQLELERRELAVKHRLKQLNVIDLTEDDAQVKAESRGDSTDDTQVPIFDTSFAGPQPAGGKRATSTSTAQGPEEKTLVEEQQQHAGSTVTATATDEPKPSRLVRYSGRKNTKPEHQRCPSPAPAPAPTPTSTVTPTSQLADTPTTEQSLLAMFMGKANDTVAKLQPGAKRLHTSGDEASTTSSEPSEKVTKKMRAERTCNNATVRKSRVRVHKEPDSGVDGLLTDSEQYELIGCYKDLLFNRMQTTERALNLHRSYPVTSRMRRLNVGSTPRSITLLHREFDRVITEHAKSSSIRSGLQAELEKFENALPYWSPKCKALPRQTARLAMVRKVVEEIAKGRFNSESYKDSYNPFDEL